MADIDIEAIRHELPPVTRYTYLQTAGMAPAPRQVIAAVQAYLEAENEEGPASPRVGSALPSLLADLRAALGRLINCAGEDIALTHNATDGINIGLWSIDWQPGDELVISNQEHPAVLLPVYNLADRFGVVLRWASVSPGDDPAATFAAAIGSRTRAICVSHVSRRTGRVMPIRALADLAKSHGARVIVDGAQSVGNVTVDVQALGCDYYTLCGPKWLLGPKGTGGVYVRPGALAETKLTWIGSHSQESFDNQGGHVWLPTAARLEYGTQANALYAGLLESLKWLDGMGWDAVRRRAHGLARMAAARLAAVPGLTVLRGADEQEQSGIVGFRLPPGYDNRQVYERLFSERGVLISPLEHGTTDMRVATHFFNNDEDLDALERGLRALLSLS